MPAEHKFLRLVLPRKAFNAVRAGTRKWLIECPCRHKRDYWDAGGVRYKAVGEPRQYLKCPKCKQARWHKVRRKTKAEIRAFEALSAIKTAAKSKAVCPSNDEQVYSSGSRKVTQKQCYRIYTDRLELDCPLLFKKTFVIQADEIVDVWIGAGTTIKDIPRLGGIFSAWRCLKLDLADAFRHVVIKSRRAGYFKSFAFVPEKPDEFLAQIKKKLF